MTTVPATQNIQQALQLGLMSLKSENCVTQSLWSFKIPGDDCLWRSRRWQSHSSAECGGRTEEQVR